jgi:teichuronic acid biosynthesis glycosyltransferase TuaG
VLLKQYEEKISVIIPTWNRAHLLVDAIESVLNQTISVFEVLVCDDGSTDNSKDVVESIADSRVKWISGARAGLPAVPRNRGIRMAQGDWIAFLDSDDIWLPGKLEAQFECLKDIGGLAISTNAIVFQVKKNLKTIFFNDDKPIKNITFSNLLLANKVITSSVLVHRSLLDRVGLFSESDLVRGIEDYDLWLRVSTFTNILYISQPLVQYRDQVEFSARAHGGSPLGQKIRGFLKYGYWIIKEYPLLFWQIVIFVQITLMNGFLQIYSKMREQAGLFYRGLSK